MRQNQKSEIKELSREEGLARIYKYCAYQERSHQDVKHKLFTFGLRSHDVDRILSQLIVEGFLNEERFAKAFAGGKFRMQKWGRNKIVYALQGRGLTENCIQRGLWEISEPDYRRTLRDVITKKSKQTKEANSFKKRDRVARFAIARGFEPELVWEVVKDVLRD